MDLQYLSNSITLSLLYANRLRVEDWNFKKITNPYTRIYLLKDGDGTIKIKHNNRKIELKTGRLYLFPGSTLYEFSSNSYLDHYFIHFFTQISGGSDLFKLLTFQHETDATEADYYLIKRVMELNPVLELNSANSGKHRKEESKPMKLGFTESTGMAGRLETQGILLQLLSRFLLEGDQSGIARGLYQNSKIMNVIKYIQLNLSHSYSLSELADFCHLSEDYFSRLFLKTTGLRPVEYINLARIKEAEIQLVSTNDPIKKIAMEVGIDNIHYFNRLFKKFTSNNPGEYRMMHKKVIS